jgi:hypothetical protein
MEGNNVILFKRSSVPNRVPEVSALSAGEIAVNVTDGTLFTKKIVNGVEEIVTFSNSEANPYSYNPSFSSIVVTDPSHYNTVSQVFATVLGGYYNDVSGGGSTVINGENNDIAGDYAFIGSGADNKITANGDYSAILGGQNNLVSHQNSFTIGSNLSSHAENFTYVNNISGTLWGDGGNITSIDATNITSGTLNATRLPVFEGDITTTIGSASATVVKLQGSPISTQPPVNGQTLQWTGTAWTPGAIPNGGSGGGGLVYYLNFANQAQTPTTNLSSTPNTPKELGITGTTSLTSVTLNNVSTTNYNLICGFVSLTANPNTTVIPAGLWDFNIWADSTATTTNQMILKLDVYKYDGSNVPTLLASSGDIYIYDPVTTAQYIASVVFPQTTLSTTDRIYIELRAKGTQNNKNVTIYFGGTSPTHVHTTFPSVGGSGLVKVINGVYQTPASLLVNSDVASNAAIEQTKIDGLVDTTNKANSSYTTVQTNSANWESVYTSVKQVSSNWDSSYTTVQTNSANWQTAYAYVSANSVNLTATNIFVNNNLTVTNTVSAKYYQGTLLDWMTLVRGYKTTPTLLATIGTGEVYTYVFATTGADRTYYRYIATDGNEDSFYGNFTNPTLSNLIARKAIIL